ncbi:MAG: ABC transporter substrate-binding protein [Pseudomonadota bacterium]|nr:ABC transporter substrate-binding protein [Pseudomonadota bacterium]
MKALGYELVDGGRYQNMSDDFSAQISASKEAGVEIVTVVQIPPDFTTFFNQSAQQGFAPKVMSVAKATEFPQGIAPLGGRANYLATEVWWSPMHPFASSFTGQTSKDLADTYTAATGNPWTMPLGFKHSLIDPAAGPARLLFAFEAVIIGGLGNLWGTLLGGIILGVAQSIGTQIDAGHLPLPRCGTFWRAIRGWFRSGAAHCWSKG